MSSNQSNASSVDHESNAAVASWGDTATNHHLPSGNDSPRHEVKHGDSSNKIAAQDDDDDDDDLAAPPDLNVVYLTVPNLSLEPMTAASLVTRVHDTMTAVTARYLPCALFFIRSQGHLDFGLQQQQNTNNELTAPQFFETYVAPLPGVFKGCFFMQNNVLDGAYRGLKKLVGHVKLSCSQGSVQVVMDFTGGLREGRPYGLRKWLSDHGQGLSLCANLECILQACVKLDPSLDTTRKIAKLIRPMAQKALDELLNGIPMYSRNYLPSFHRLMTDLRDMSNLNPNNNDDDIQVLGDSKPAASNQDTVSVKKDGDKAHEVICIDDDSDSEDNDDDGDDDDDCDKENDKTNIAATASESGLCKAAVQTKTSGRDAVDHSLRLSWDAVNRILRRHWGLVVDHSNDENPTVPPAAADTPTSNAEDQNPSSATILNENEEKTQESATTASSRGLVGDHSNDENPTVPPAAADAPTNNAEAQNHSSATILNENEEETQESATTASSLGLVVDHSNDENSTVPPAAADTPTNNAEDQNHSSATILNENEENTQESATTASSWGLVVDHSNDENSSMPPAAADAPTSNAEDQNHSSATILNENEEKAQESTTTASSQQGFYNTVIQSKTGATVTVKRSLRLR